MNRPVSYPRLFLKVWLQTILLLPLLTIGYGAIFGIIMACFASSWSESLRIVGGWLVGGACFGLVMSVSCGWLIALVYSLVEWNFLNKHETPWVTETLVQSAEIPLAMYTLGERPPVEENPYRYD